MKPEHQKILDDLIASNEAMRELPTLGDTMVFCRLLGPIAIKAIMEGKAAVVMTNPLDIPGGRQIEAILYSDGDQYPISTVRIDHPTRDRDNA